ncbi:tail fiber domain-containing protein [Fluviicola sp.]|uniref:tail fiber domain-containing protein n=1 Tax=Fluviicola sp. TaxID=1917219 RepID=UPI003D2DD50B
MTLKNTTGFLGLGTISPASLFHINGNGAATPTGSVFRTDGPGNVQNNWRFLTDGDEKFRIYVLANTGHTFLETKTANHILGLGTGGSFSRMTLQGQPNGFANSGFATFGNDVPLNFIPRDRIQLYHDSAEIVAMRYSNLSTGVAATDGTRTGIEAAGDFRITQFESQNTDFWTPGASSTTPVQRFRIQSNGQVLIGNSTLSENVISGSPISGFSSAPSSLLNVHGPINSCYPDATLADQPTVLYGYTSPTGNPSGLGSGFRMHKNFTKGGTDYDALVFEKTDGANADPLGYITFTNTGNDNNEEISAYIDGTGRSYFGRNMQALGTRLTIESESSDAEDAGLRFVNLTSAATPLPTNPGSGVLAVDSDGDVIYVQASSGSGFGNLCSASDIPLTGDFEIPMADHNYHFTGNNLLNQNHVGIGYDCDDVLPAKLSVYQLHPATVAASTIGISGINDDVANMVGVIFTGVEGKAMGVQTEDKLVNRGGYFTAINSADTRGVVIEIPASTQNTAMAIGGEFLVSASASQNTGVSASSTGTGSHTINKGVYGAGRNSSDFNIGGDFIATSIDPNAFNVGVSGSANDSDIGNVGGSFVVTSNNTAANMAVAARAGVSATPTYPASVAIGVYSNAAVSNNGLTGYAAFFDGNAWINGPATTTGYALTTSDRRFKTDIQPIADASEILGRINPKTYFFDTTNTYGLNFSNRKQYGLIAQEVEKVMPELVHNQTKPAMINTEGKVVTPGIDYKAMNYDAFISILIKGHQEQQDEMVELTNTLQKQNIEIKQENKELKNQLDALNAKFAKLEDCLQNMLPGLCDVNQGTINQTSPEQQLTVNLSDKNTIVLNQNVPNPFAESTVITYSIPATVKKAQIHFYDASGRLLQSVEISERGAGRLQVFGSDLSSGTYTYSLVADGDVVATKKLVKE